MAINEDEKLVKDYLAGDESALIEIIGRYTKPIYNFIYRSIGNSDESSDLTQEVFLKVWKSLKKFDQRKKFKTWIYAIARNASIDWLRKKRNLTFSDIQKNLGDEDSIENIFEDPEPLADEIFDKVESDHSVREALSELSIDQQNIIILRTVNDLTFEEIGDIVNKPMNTVKSQYHRALKVLKKNLQR